MRNWYVITGGPSAGKTTLIKALEESGFHVEHEIARLIIDRGLAQGKRLEEIRGNEDDFTIEVHRQKLIREQRLDPQKLIFFDRGMQDSYAYLMLYGAKVLPHIKQEMLGASYKKVFLLESSVYQKDYARTESENDHKKIFSLLKEAYEMSGIPTDVIPMFSTKEKRIKYFLEFLEEREGLKVSQKFMV